jgi:hypothetical protein
VDTAVVRRGLKFYLTYQVREGYEIQGLPFPISCIERKEDLEGKSFLKHRARKPDIPPNRARTEEAICPCQNC